MSFSISLSGITGEPYTKRWPAAIGGLVIARVVSLAHHWSSPGCSTKSIAARRHRTRATFEFSDDLIEYEILTYKDLFRFSESGKLPRGDRAGFRRDMLEKVEIDCNACSNGGERLLVD